MSDEKQASKASKLAAELYVQTVIEALGFGAEVHIRERDVGGDPLSQNGWIGVKVCHPNRWAEKGWFFAGWVTDDFKSTWTIPTSADYFLAELTEDEAERFSNVMPAVHAAYDRILKGRL